MGAELFAFDFKDAFYTMHIREGERRHVVARGSKHFVAFKCVAFGLACGPLLWGRLAASAARFAQAIFAPGELRVQTYVDDPAGVVYGKSKEERNKLIAIYLLFCRTLGFDINWKKVQRGRVIDWIGGRFELTEEEDLKVTLSAEKAQVLRKALDDIVKKGMVTEKELRSTAGLASWAASVVPRARPFVSHMFGAMVDNKAKDRQTKESTRDRPKNLVFVRRFRHAALWLRELLADEHALVRKFSVRARWAPLSLGLRTDASPYGLGAILFKIATGEVISYWADDLRDEDFKRFKAQRGDPAWQNEWEMLAVLASIVAFESDIAGEKFLLQADNMTAIEAASRYKSTRPLINTMAGELALRMDKIRTEMTMAEHIPGILNVEADALSRLSVGKVLPRELREAHRLQAPSRSDDFWMCWPQEW